MFEVRINTSLRRSLRARTQWLNTMKALGAVSAHNGLESGVALIQYEGSERNALQMASYGQEEKDVAHIKVLHIHTGKPRYAFWMGLIEKNFPDAIVEPLARGLIFS